MRRRFSLLVVVCLFSVLAARAQNNFTVSESETTAVFAANKLDTRLVLDNKAQKSFSAKIKLEILDTEDEIIASRETSETIRRGRQIVQIPLQFAREQNEKSLLWNRLRYTITPAENSEKALIIGVVSLSEIMPDIFELRATATDRIFAGMNYRVRVRAFHPVTNLPVANVKINALVKLDIDTESDDDELKLTAAAKTDRAGFAVLDFKIPENIKLDDDGDLKITGEKNGVAREAEKDLDAAKSQSAVYLVTDKPIYQPAQNFYVRALSMNQTVSGSNTIAAEKDLEFVVKDEDDTILYRETVKTSRFGVASAAWKIPENAKLGTYQIRVKDEDGEEIGAGNFKVSRYDLPNFTVTAKPGKTFYLPEDTAAEITVSAEYLFGKAVERGAVKVVRETERRWNYAKQKYDTEEEKPLTGATDADGKFVAKVDLAEAHADLKASDYKRFEDLQFAAYFTDLTTNRTEQRRFDVRVTKQAIHVYLAGIDSYSEHNPKLPVAFYVSTFYADGAPAACAVEIKGKYADETDAQVKTLASLKTNSLGAGRAEFAAPPRADETYFKDLQIKVAASDALKQTGTQEEEIDIDEDAREIQIRTTKAIYKNGEAINAEIVSTEADADVFVDVVKDSSVVASQIVKLKNNRANLKIPYDANFKGELVVAAYFDDGDGDAVKDAAGIIFPHPNNLKLAVETVKTVYRPNEEASVDFKVDSPERKNLETALGVVVFDKAIEERARTDAEFGGERVNQFGNLYRLLDSDLNRLDLSKPVSTDLQLRAALMLAGADFYPDFFDSDYYGANLKKKFESFFKRQFAPVEDALANAYKRDFTHPADESSLRKILLASSLDFANLKDPWENAYRADFTVERDENVVSIKSAGANKKFGDKDDFVVLQMKFKYFTPVGQMIGNAVRDYHARTNKFVRDYATLRDELKKQNVDLDALKDRWNHPYQIKFDVYDRFYTIDVKSYGADGKLDVSYGDDFFVWTNRADYFADAETKIQTILSNFAAAKKSFPQSEIEFKEILRSGGVDFDALRDGWNHSLYLEFSTYSRYADKVKTEVVGKYGEASAEKLSILPVTQQVAVFRLRSAGADAAKGTYDDFNAATFSGVIAEQSKTDAKPVELKTETVFTGGKGAVRGTVRDANGAVIPNAKITATNEQTNGIFEAATNEDGVYLLANLPSGKYTIRAEAGGFQSYVVQNVPVRSSTVSELNFEMNVAGIQSTVEVTAAAETMNSTNASMSATVTTVENTPGFNISQENSTPRLREYFPETLVWNPELITDKNGKAELKFKLADNLTTWKLYVVGSNADGRVGIAEREIKTFQPFFVDLEPPKILTVGDEIALPAQIRNYTEKTQTVAVSMARAGWFDFINSPNQSIEVLPNATENAIFNFRATAATKDGKQTVTAIAAKDSDAIEKPVAVHPDGREMVETQSDIFRDGAAFDVDFPADALPKTNRARLKIYPNLMAHVAESIEGLLKRPYGCGEQTISSTYPNLMILKVARNSKNALPEKLQAQAQKFLRQGYERLIGYQTEGGGFSYWGSRDAPDIALTAYALRFLDDARDFIDVDADAMAQANKWLLAQQRADGSWTKIYSWEKTEDRQRTKILTTYIARVLATNKTKIKPASDAKTAAQNSASVPNIETSLQKAFDYLKKRNDEIDEPYALASFALALLDAGDAPSAQPIIEKLEKLAIAENGGAYWNLETNTPFNGWGTAGRIETTALVVQALEKFKVQNQSAVVSIKDKGQATNDEDLISKGTMFLLKNKDSYGVWYSTQATVNVLDAILAVVGGENENAPNRTAQIFVGGQKVKNAALPPANVLAYPLEVDLSETLAADKNRVEIKIDGGTSATMAQIVSDYYVSWQNSAANGRDVNQSRQLRLDYNCDAKTARIMQEINCSMEAERIGFRGYGMLLAEIGLPPGADVDRASLEKAREENWNFSRYDVLPDRIVIYMWAQAGGTRINFKFKPRYGITAQTAPLIVYDYYNPEAQATVAPLRFSVK